MRSIITLALAALLLGSAASAQPKKAPNFSLKTSDGKVVELAKLQGKVVVVNFWATWCGPCRREIPDFIDVYKKYKDKGLEIVGISLDEGGWEDVTPFMKKTPMPYPVVIGTTATVRPWGDINAIPTTFIVDKAGNIVNRHVGMMNKTALEAAITPHLK